MPRANRHYIPGYVWHITHQCHKKEFLLKFTRDRKRWLEWLFEARKRYGVGASAVSDQNGFYMYLWLFLSQNAEKQYYLQPTSRSIASY